MGSNLEPISFFPIYVQAGMWLVPELLSEAIGNAALGGEGAK